MNVSVQNDWYKDFFSGLNCEMWERVASDAWTQTEVDFLIDVLNVPPGALLLDIPCGFGRHTVELAKRGYSMTGVDISNEFIQTLRRRVADQNLPVEVVHGDVLTTQFAPTFDGACCLGNSFGYVDYEGMNAFVGNVAASLKPKARWVINSGLLAESILPHFPTIGHYVLDDLIMDVTNTYAMEESCVLTELTYTQEDRSEKHYFKHYVYTFADIRRLLAKYGLRVLDAYSSTEKQTYQLGDKQIYMVAEKL